MKIVVFGAAGHVGSAVCKDFSERGHQVLALRKSPSQRFPISSGSMECDHYNVASMEEGPIAQNCRKKQDQIDAIIYCVGHCPEGGFKEAIKWPLTEYPLLDLQREISMHIHGPFNVFRKFLGAVKFSGHFMFMSTAATRILEMPIEKRPPIHIYPHLAVIAAENALIEGMRIDPETERKGVKIHKICPPRISDSPFHSADGAIPASSKAPVSVTTDEVVGAIVRCMESPFHEDVDMSTYTSGAA